MSIYLIAAYVIFLGGICALGFSIWARQRRLGREIAALEARLEKKTSEV
jgi:hypothetical protein